MSHYALETRAAIRKGQVKMKNRNRASRAARHRAAICAILVCAGLAFAVCGCNRPGGAVVIENGGSGQSDASGEAAAEEETVVRVAAGTDPAETLALQPAGETPAGQTQEGQIYVHVCGQVRSPGVYGLPEGSRVTDAVEAAGGFLAEAAAEAVNLAARVADGSKVVIPSKEEAQAALGVSGWYEEESQPAKEAAGGGAVAPVNINEADAGQLTAIPGIGQTRAEAIVAYREENGPFRTAEDIMKVTGIKDGLFAKIKDYITVGG